MPDSDKAEEAEIPKKGKVKNGKAPVKEAVAGGEAAPKPKRQRQPAGEPKATFASRPCPKKEAYAKQRFLCHKRVLRASCCQAPQESF